MALARPLPSFLEALALGLLAAGLRLGSLPAVRGAAFHPGFAFLFAATLLYGPGAALPWALGGALGNLARRRPVRPVLVEAGSDALRAGAGGAVLRLLGGEVPAGPPGLPFLGACAAALAAMLVLDLLLAQAHLAWTRGGRYPLRLVLLDAAQAPLAVLAALAWRNGGPAGALLALACLAGGMALVRLAGRGLEKERLYQEALAAAGRLQAAQEELLQSRKMASLGFLAAGVAHEINNPLLALQTNLELLQDEVQGEEARESLHLMAEALRRCRHIVDQLLGYARARARPDRTFDLVEAVEQALDLCQPLLAMHQVRLEKEAGGPLWVHGQADEMVQVFVNLVANAAQAAASGTAPRRVAVGCAREGGEAVVRVEDSGPGIPPELMDRLFDPFVTGKDVGQGTGLGLTISHGIVRRHRGRLLARNRAAGGACLEVRLPGAQGPPPPGAEAGPPG